MMLALRSPVHWLVEGGNRDIRKQEISFPTHTGQHISTVWGIMQVLACREKELCHEAALA